MGQFYFLLGADLLTELDYFITRTKVAEARVDYLLQTPPDEWSPEVIRWISEPVTEEAGQPQEATGRSAS